MLLGRDTQEVENPGDNTKEEAADKQVAEFETQVDKTTMDEKVVKVSHEALREVMKGWKGVGKRGDKNPEVVMIVPCSVKDQHPVEGKGYMLCVGKKVSQIQV